MMRRFGALGIALALIVALFALAPASSDPGAGVSVPTLAEHNALEARVTELEDRATAADHQDSAQNNRLDALEEWVASAPTPSPTPTPTPTETPTPTPTPTPEPAAFPTRDSVGPAVEPTQTYAGDCYFSADESGLVVDGKIVDCRAEGIRFAEQTQGIVFRNSVIKGQMMTIASDAANDDNSRPIVYTVEDSRIVQDMTGGAGNWQDRAACCTHFAVKRSLIQGTHSALLAHNQVTLVGNYITTDGTDGHSSGLRMLKNSVLRGNTITCKAVNAYPDAGCSAAAVFYRERVDGTPAAVVNLTIEGNYFKRDTAGGPYYATRFAGCNTATDCAGIKFTGNVFDRGWGTDAGEFPLYGDNVWSGNTWSDNGAPAPSGG